jgi:hypothetical protein
MNKKIPSVKEVLESLFDEIVSDEFNRGKSWEYCYGYFKKNFVGKTNVNHDMASLQLMAYLASWGMYRGSSNILSKNYQFLQGITKLLIKDEYTEIWNTNLNNISEASKSRRIGIILKLKEKIDNYFKKYNMNPTNTRTSKILLGTMACSPAYDKYVKKGLRLLDYCQTFNYESLNQIIEFYNNHSEDFNYKNWYKSYNKVTSIVFPPMKLSDMYFWHLGFMLGVKESLDKCQNEAEKSKLTKKIAERRNFNEIKTKKYIDKWLKTL